MSNKYVSYDEAVQKLESYCAYQERCHQEVHQKLKDLGIFGEDIDQITAHLIENNYLNELRFATLFAGGRFRIKKWGRIKIKLALKQKRISEYCIKKALQTEIPEEDYYQTLLQVLEKKDRTLREPNAYKYKQKLARYAQERGFESPLVWSVINDLYA